jgi:hypothetical protein
MEGGFSTDNRGTVSGSAITAFTIAGRPYLTNNNELDIGEPLTEVQDSASCSEVIPEKGPTHRLNNERTGGGSVTPTIVSTPNALASSAVAEGGFPATKSAVFSWCQQHRILPRNCPSCGESFEADSSFPSYKLCPK